MTTKARKSIIIILFFLFFIDEAMAMESKNHPSVFGGKNIGDLNIDSLKLILCMLDNYSQQSFSDTSKYHRRLGTMDIINENIKHGYEGWPDIQEINVFQIFWISDHLLELLGLYLNLHYSRTCTMDDYRFDKICKRFRKSFLPENSVVREYVEFLSHKTDLILKDWRRSRCILPDFDSLGQSPNNNERGIYLFHRYLHSDKIDLEGLKSDPLFKEIKGAFGIFLCGAISNIPLYQEMKSIEDKVCPFWDKNKIINYTKQGITAQELERVVLSDPGISRVIMGDILFTISTNKTQFPLADDMLKKLAKYIIKYDISSDYNFNKILLPLFEQALPLERYAQLLHRCLCTKEQTIMGEYNSAYGVDDRRELHAKAIKIFRNLGRHDLVELHKKCIVKIVTAMTPTYYENVARRTPLR